MRGAKAKAVYDPAIDAVSLSISPYPGAVFTWSQRQLEIVDTSQGAEAPTGTKLHLEEDVCRALYEALGRYFGGDVVDARRLRADYDAERGRVDKFIAALIERQAG